MSDQTQQVIQFFRKFTKNLTGPTGNDFEQYQLAIQFVEQELLSNEGSINKLNGEVEKLQKEIEVLTKKPK